ncbi:MAG: hypothetical protein K6U87_05805 [Firmicutes bacterium]|nr:hypothetical protein [Bacillota bacterium]
MTALDFLSPDEGWIAVQRPPGSTPQGAIAGTTDGGRHWRTLVRWTGTPPWHFPYSDGPLVPTALDFVDPQHGWALVPLGGGACQAEFGVLRTSDGGAQWLPAGVLLGSDGPVSLAFGTRQVGWVSNGSCAGAYTSVSASTDGGTAWRPWSRWYPASPDAALAPTATALGAASATHAWMVNAYWNYAAPAPHAPVLQALTTDDGGTTWTGHLLPTSGLAGRIAALGFLTPDVGWVVTAQGSRTTLAGTLDAGRHWQTLALPGPSGTVGPVDRVTIQVGYAVQTLPPTLHAPAGSSRLWVTDDGGRSWQPVALPEP